MFMCKLPREPGPYAPFWFSANEDVDFSMIDQTNPSLVYALMYDGSLCKPWFFIEISGGGSTDQLVKISVNDTTSGFLSAKVANLVGPAFNSSAIKYEILNPAANEQMLLWLDLSNYIGDITITGDLTVNGDTILNGVTNFNTGPVNFNNVITNFIGGTTNIDNLVVNNITITGTIIGLAMQNDTFIGDNVTTVFILAMTANNANESVYVNGLRQTPTTDYTATTTQITFVVAPAISDVIVVDYLG